jgi:hypothetical protein
MTLLVTCPLAKASVDVVLRMDTSWGHNSNLFRNDASQAQPPQATDTPPLAAGPTATSTHTRGAALTVGIPLGSPETRLVLSTTLTTERIGAAPELNHTGHRHTARLPWRYTDLWDGEVSAGNVETAYPVDDFYTRLDLVEQRWLSASVRLKPTPYLELPLQGLTTATRHADGRAHGALDQNVTSTSASVLYRSGLGNTAQLGMIERRIAFSNRIDATTLLSHEEHERDTFVEVQWSHSPKTRLGFRWATRLKTVPDSQFATSRQNLFRLSAAHSLSAYTRLEAQAWRQPYQNVDAQANYGISKGHGLGVVWTPSHKVLIRTGWQKDAQQDLALYANPSGLALNPTTQRTSIRVEYLLERGFTAFATAARETRVRRERDTARQTTWHMGVEYRYENLPGAAQRAQPAFLPDL